ncbi:MAG: tRNA pseudouridine13 synthase [Candidatus Woesearchaeota archaeon]|nr:tRNA pseudouridine13 synthase [Candidatus Woesearchaeota archaeon]MDN5327951.1 tRNA pseudouridine13 synthase [Candidatus Woesearchaeota archaeon]
MKIKELPEDFIVEEIPYDYFLKDNGFGIHYYYWLIKKNIEQQKAIKKVSKITRKKIKEISFSGIKDKKAITKQIFSVKGKLKSDENGLVYKDDEIEIWFAGRGKRPVSIGFAKGNRFTITVRDLPASFELKREPSKIPNYYDSQRFGRDLNALKLGKAIITGNFGELINAMKISDFNEIREKFTKYQIRFFLSAYGSYIFNQVLMRLIKSIEEDNVIEKLGFVFIKNKNISKIKNDLKVPIPGFGLDEEINDIVIYKQEIKQIYDEILREENITDRSFIIKSIPEISNEAMPRDAFIKVENFKVLEETADELNKGKKKIKLSFELPPGSYATMVIKDLFVDLI